MTRQLVGAAVALLAVSACYRSTRVNTTATMQQSPSTPALPSGVTPQLIARGDSIYHAPTASCHRCHAMDATGGRNAPNLKTGPWLHVDGSVDQIAALIISGVPRDRIKDPTRTLGMNPRGGPMNLSDQDARAVAAYVWSISREKGKE